MLSMTQTLPVLTGRHMNYFAPGCTACGLLDPQGLDHCWACAENLNPTLSHHRRPKNEDLARTLYDLAARARRGEKVSRDLCVLVGRTSHAYGEVTKDISPCFGHVAGRHQALIVCIGGQLTFINMHRHSVVIQSLATGLPFEATLTLHQGQAARLASDMVEVLAVNGQAARRGMRCLITF